MMKELIVSLFLVGAGYLLGRTKKQADDMEQKDKDNARIIKAQKDALNLTDDDCDKLQRLFDKFDGQLLSDLQSSQIHRK